MRAAEGAVEPGEWMGPGYRGAGCKRAHVLRFSVLLQGPGKLRLKASWSAGKGGDQTGAGQGVRPEPAEGLGPGDRGAGHAPQVSERQPAAVSVDGQHQPLL